MATAGELTGKVAELTGFSLAYVTEHQRRLRNARMMTFGGRGRSAPRMGLNDPIRLLFSLAASQTAKDGPDRVRYFRRLALPSKTDVEIFGLRFKTGWRLEDRVLNLMNLIQRRILAGDLGDRELTGKLIIRNDVGTATLKIRHTPRDAQEPGPLHELHFTPHADDMLDPDFYRLLGHKRKMITRETTIDLEALIELTAFVTYRTVSGDA